MSFLVHHGIVFPSGGSYIGSALRQARAPSLPGCPEHIEHGATSDFAGFAQSWDAQPIRFEKFADPDIDPGVLRFTLAATPVPRPGHAAGRRRRRGTPEALPGGASGALYGGRRRGARFEHPPRQLVEELCSEIDDAQARARFRNEALSAAPTPQLKSPAWRTTS